MSASTTGSPAATWNATVIQGGEFQWSGPATDASGNPFSFVGGSWQITISGRGSTTLLALTSSPTAGIAISGTGNNILTVTITGAQTAALPNGGWEWTWVYTDASGNPWVWVMGTLTVIGA